MRIATMSGRAAPNVPVINAAIYTRVSTEDQAAGSFSSLAAQRE